ncbi:hypothetical protein QOZ80_3AG0222130 [Eleusine coracana subsp. coracana]|nr:hypothetical protein QOZ80_3AG0222130 [Eleusine coracana subsp. coracana]
MDDSSLFMQWALSTLQQEHPPAPAPNDGFSTLPELENSESLNSIVPAEPPAREGNRATGSWSSGDTDIGSGWSPSENSATNTNQPVSWSFSSASARPSKEATMRHSIATATRATDDSGGVPHHESPPTRRAVARSSRSSPPAPYVQHHILAERKRREKINQRFIELSTVIPSLKKMDKATILSDATRYLKELQEKLKAHEDDHRKIQSSVPTKKPRITVPDDKDGGSPSYVADVPTGTSGALPEIEARISEGNVMVRIHCEDVKGSLVRLFAEVEELHLSIVHANAMPFSASTLIIHIMAEVEESFSNTTAHDIVGRLSCALKQHSRNSKEGTRSCCRAE